MIHHSQITQRLREQADLRQIAGEYVKLQKRGPDLWAPCPFHAGDDTASFKATATSWHCFGCNQHGDVLDFLMKIEGISFLAARQLLADRLGIPIEHEHLTPQQLRERKRQRDLAMRLKAEAPIVREWMRRQIEGARAMLRDPRGYRQWRLWVKLARADHAVRYASDGTMLRLYARMKPQLSSGIVLQERARVKRLAEEVKAWIHQQ